MTIPFRFIQCGDLHLGAPFGYLKTLGRQADEAVRYATYRAFEGVVQLALDEQVDALLITGDVYNSDDHNLEAQVRFARECERLQEAHIPVFMVQGNHDPAESWQAHVSLPANVHIFSADEPERRSLIVQGREVAGIYGMSISRKNSDVDLASQIKVRADDVFSIALIHGTVGSQPNHVTTAPCSMDTLLRSPINYWAFGHIHKRQVLHEVPYVVYAGNTQGLHGKEVGPKGCYLVTVGGNGRVLLDFRETGAIRFAKSHIDITGLRTSAELEEMIRHKKEMLRKGKKPVLQEIVLTGSGPLHRAAANESTRQMWMEAARDEEAHRIHFILPYRIIDETWPEIDLAERRQLHDMVGDYLAAYDAAVADGSDESVIKLRDTVLARPETKRLGLYRHMLTPELVRRALRRAETEGALRLLGDSYED